MTFADWFTIFLDWLTAGLGLATGVAIVVLAIALKMTAWDAVWDWRHRRKWKKKDARGREK